MELYEYYTYNVTDKGEIQVEKVEDPMPKDGYSHEPLVYVDPDGDELEDLGLPFDGVSINFAGDRHTVGIIRSENVDPQLLNTMMWGKEATPEAYYYRTGVYHEDETHTGWDAVVCVSPL